MDKAFTTVRNIFGENQDYVAFHDLKELKESVEPWLESQFSNWQKAHGIHERMAETEPNDPVLNIIEARARSTPARSFEDIFDSSEEFYEAIFDRRLRHIFTAIGEAVFYIVWIALAVVGWALLWEATSATEDVRWEVVAIMAIVTPAIAAIIAVLTRLLLPVVTQGVLMMRRHPEPVAAWRSFRKRWP